ncbi:vitamin B12 dependent-methionine synthase activation domain-containing protein [Clostridium sp. YIM B02555]|uniref:vitamin B12 dependent-methionine synthase activation domain-containing protein n=1 Tax=Clostridium sp. YIM B02555 TaxID=2911968 RepID=UPI001EEEBF22|nr:vitamin B12 dependent-methionine synthase activation domain-containing protein [Clostridium sp. YIM B02555]
MNVFELAISRKEVLRYLGYKGQALDENLERIIDEVREEVKKVIIPRVIYEYKDIITAQAGVEVIGTNLILKGKDIKEHLKKSKKCVLLAVTLGNEVEKKTRLYEKTDLTKALILDACATAAVEEVCDAVENVVKEKAAANGCSITFRYSPGYGDLPLDVQNSFLRALDAQKKIGLTVSENNLLFPRKSVTAIIGIVEGEIEKEKRTCKECNNYENCNFRREGESCGA